MRIILQEEDQLAADREVSITDDGFAVPGWITLKVGDQLQDIYIDELHRACITLYSKYRNQLDKEESRA